MKLVAKLTVVFVALMTIITLIVALVAAQIEWNVFRAAHERIAQSIFDVSRQNFRDAWKKSGETGLSLATDKIESQSELYEVQWIWFSSQTTFAEGQPTPNVRSMTIGSMQTVIGRSKDGFRNVHTYLPLIDQGNQLGGLDVSESMDHFDDRVERIWWTSLGAILSMLLLSAITLALVGARIVGRPLEKLVDKTNRAAAGDFSQPLEFKGNNELAILASALNEMCDELESQRTQIESETQARMAALNQLRHADRLQTIGQLASGIAHEVGTPLNVIQGHADLIDTRKLTPDEVSESVKTIKDEVSRMTNIVRQVLNLARRKTGTKETTDLVRLVRDTMELLHTAAHQKDIHLLLTTELNEAAVFCDPEQLKQVFINLQMNAIQAMPDGGHVELSIEETASPPRELALENLPGEVASSQTWYLVRIQDQGMGIDETNLNRIFDPFFTTKDPGEGTGLGLSIAYGIVQEHNGQIEVTSDPSRGTEFDVYLPANSRTPHAE